MTRSSREPATRPPARRVGRPTQPTDVPAEEEILARGLAAFAELGYDGASVRELARRLSVSHNFINDRYGSKERFWRAVVDRSLTGRVARLRAALGAEQGDDLARLRNLVHAFHQANVADPDVRRILQYESMRGGGRLEYVFERYLVPVREAVAPLVQRLVEEGRVPPIPIDVMVFAVVAMTSVSAEVPFVSLLGDTFAADPRGYARMLSDILLDGLVINPER
ncbi:MAG: TetR/AcrR family transcriptional regulator [Chloroflexi bacterium]|nr:MAG: TetR/AcrR family transcriptional regulator [Chloroflexota bacterium]